MKVVVLYALAGGGHLSAARALKTELERQGHEVALEDSTKPFGRLIDFCCCDLYRFSAKYVPHAFGVCYRLTDRKKGGSGAMRALGAPLAKRLLPVIERHRPDLVVCAYPFSCQLVGLLKAEGLLQARVAHLLTDYGTHAAWVTAEADEYWASCEEAGKELMHRGVPKEKITVRGIPVNPKFRERPDRTALRRELSLPEAAPVLLFMAGSFGVRSVFRVFRAIDTLPDAFEAVVITGKNEKLFHRFQKLAASSRHRLHPILFTDRVADYMHTCDLLVTKPGGLTTSEALAAGIPLAVFDPIPGQEEDNARYLSRHGLAVLLHPRKPVGSLRELGVQIPDTQKNKAEIR